MPMTARDAIVAIEKLRSEIGPKAYLCAHLTTYPGQGEPLSISIYPQDVTHECACRASGEDWDQLIANVHSVWAAYKTEHYSRRLKEMALAIIRITHIHGECFDAALRMEFDAGEIASFGAQACTEADRMASNGPFKIVATASANAA